MSEPTLKNRPKEKDKTYGTVWYAAQCMKWFEGFEKKMRKLYTEYCETRIHDMKADAIATFIEEEIFGQEPAEIFGETT